ncbi:beta-ketoacyl synthase chain length factor [Treponema sp. R6D11]
MNAPYISRLCAWAPGIENPSEWEQWAQGKRDISSDTQSPAIAFTDSLFRRRLSQISKMTVQVVHDLLPVGENTKMFFVSFRGELSRQYQINKMLIEEKSLMPAAFSLSVFNAPAALASIALGLKGGYSALYPGNNSFAAGLSAASASFVSEKQEELIFVYADEQAPPEYGRYVNECSPAIAFAFLLTREPQSFSIPLSSVKEGEDYLSGRPLDFLRRLLLCGKIHVTS